MQIALGGEIMQIKLTIALAAAAFALATCPIYAADMPAYGTKNFSAPGDAPSYFTNESGGASIRGPATAEVPDEQDDVTAADVPVVKAGAGRHGKHASAGKSGKRSATKSKGSGTSLYAKASSSRPSGAAAKIGGKGGTQGGASKANINKHAKTSMRQHAAANSAGGNLDSARSRMAV
jgi:hypothetical protein